MTFLWIMAALCWLLLLGLRLASQHRRALEAPPPPPSSLELPLVLDGETSFWDMVGQHERVFPAPQQMKPYDFWRDKFIASGDPADLAQMERFVQ